MGTWIELAAWVLIEAGRTGSARVATMRVTAVVCSGLAAVLTLAMLGCLTAALWIFALPSLGAAGAPLVAAGALSAVIVSLVTAAWLITHQGWRRPANAAAPHFLLSEATRLFNDNKGSMLLAAVVAGMAAANGGGRKP
jgi:hypothetical protein